MEVTLPVPYNVNHRVVATFYALGTLVVSGT
jgi:hypothetical protein